MKVFENKQQEHLEVISNLILNCSVNLMNSVVTGKVLISPEKVELITNDLKKAYVELRTLGLGLTIMNGYVNTLEFSKKGFDEETLKGFYEKTINDYYAMISEENKGINNG